MIRPVAQSIENIIRGHMQERNPTGRGREGKVARTEGVAPIRGLRVSLRLVHGIIRSRVEHQIGSMRGDRRADRFKVSNIELLSVVGENFVIAEDSLNGMTQLTACTSEKNVHAVLFDLTQERPGES